MRNRKGFRLARSGRRRRGQEVLGQSVAGGKRDDDHSGHHDDSEDVRAHSNSRELNSLIAHR